MNRQQAELATVVNLVAMGTWSEVNDRKYAADDHPLIVGARQNGFGREATVLQLISQTIAKNALDMIETLVDLGITPQVITSGLPGDFVKDIVEGKLLPLYAKNGTAIFDVPTLTDTPISKPVFAKQYTIENWDLVEQVNTLPPGSSVFDYIIAVKVGQRGLQQILSNRKVHLAADIFNNTKQRFVN